jgi:hypothetical protein
VPNSDAQMPLKRFLRPSKILAYNRVLSIQFLKLENEEVQTISVFTKTTQKYDLN